MQRLFAALHGTLGSYLRDALQEGSADAVACLPVPHGLRFFSSFLLFAWRLTLLFLVRKKTVITTRIIDTSIEYSS
jgi:hypothetical protein